MGPTPLVSQEDSRNFYSIHDLVLALTSKVLFVRSYFGRTNQLPDTCGRFRLNLTICYFQVVTASTAHRYIKVI